MLGLVQRSCLQYPSPSSLDHTVCEIKYQMMLQTNILPQHMKYNNDQRSNIVWKMSLRVISRFDMTEHNYNTSC